MGVRVISYNNRFGTMDRARYAGLRVSRGDAEWINFVNFAAQNIKRLIIPSSATIAIILPGLIPLP